MGDAVAGVARRERPHEERVPPDPRHAQQRRDIDLGDTSPVVGNTTQVGQPGPSFTRAGSFTRAWNQNSLAPKHVRRVKLPRACFTPPRCRSDHHSRGALYGVE